MCNLKFIDLDTSELNNNLANLELESISDEEEIDLQSYETFDETMSDPEHEIGPSLEISFLYRHRLSRLNLLYNLNMYDDLLVEDIHLVGEYFKDYDNPVHKICLPCGLSINNFFQTHSNYTDRSHYLFTPDEFKMSVIADVDYTDGTQFFCIHCDRFLYQATEAEEEECCNETYISYFKGMANNWHYVQTYYAHMSI